MKKRLLVGIGGVLFWMISPQVQAYDCKMVTAATSLSVPDLIVQRDLPVGSPIGTEMVSGVVPVYSCSNEPAPALTKQEFGVKAVGTYVMTLYGRRIYSTNIAGIGFAVGGTSVSNCNATGYVDGSNNADGNLNNRTLCYSSGLFPTQPVTARARIQFYKTAKTTGSGSAYIGNAVSFVLYNQDSWSPESIISVGSFNVKSVACSVRNTLIIVPMGTVEKRAFKGPGTWPGDANTRDIGISLDCDPHTNIFFRIDGSAQNASKGILNLSGGKDSASGVGIQLLYRDAPLHLSSQILLGNAISGGGGYYVPLKARYYQTGSDIGAGTANANATFTLTYQ